MKRGTKQKLLRLSKPIKQLMKKPYTQETVVISKNNIGKFIRPNWHREWRVGHVNIIKNSIMRGKHFSENVTVNAVNGTKYNLINGNHRMRAVREVIEKDPRFKIEITLTKYRGLKREEEINIYDIVNSTKKETGIDKVKAHCIDSDFVKRALKSFPCKVLFRGRGRTDLNALPITVIAAPYIYRNTVKFSGGQTMGLIERINALSEDDYDNIVKFLLFYKEIFGDFNGDNIYASYNLITVIGKIYYTSVGVDITRAEAVKRCRKLIKRYTAQIQMFGGTGFNGQKDLYKFVIDKLSMRKPLYNVFEAKKNGKGKKTA